MGVALWNCSQRPRQFCVETKRRSPSRRRRCESPLAADAGAGAGADDAAAAGDAGAGADAGAAGRDTGDAQTRRGCARVRPGCPGSPDRPAPTTSPTAAAR